MWLFSATISGSRANLFFCLGDVHFFFRLGVFAVLLLPPPVLGCFFFRGMGFFGTLHPYSGADLVYRSRDLYKAVRVQ